MAHKTIKQEELEVFKEELFILGFNNQQVRAEMELLALCETQEDYVRIPRVGKTITLTRTERKAIFDLYTLWITKQGV